MFLHFSFTEMHYHYCCFCQPVCLTGRQYAIYKFPGFLLARTATFSQGVQEHLHTEIVVQINNAQVVRTLRAFHISSLSLPMRWLEKCGV